MAEPCIQAERITRHGMEIEHMDKSLQAHIENGKGWRAAVAVSCVTLVLQLVSFVYFYGKLNETVDNHDKAIDRIESKIIYEVHSQK